MLFDLFGSGFKRQCDDDHECSDDAHNEQNGRDDCDGEQVLSNHRHFQIMSQSNAPMTTALNTNPNTRCQRVQGQRTASRSQFNQTGGGSGCIGQSKSIRCAATPVLVMETMRLAFMR